MYYERLIQLTDAMYKRASGFVPIQTGQWAQSSQPAQPVGGSQPSMMSAVKDRVGSLASGGGQQVQPSSGFASYKAPAGSVAEAWQGGDLATTRSRLAAQDAAKAAPAQPIKPGQVGHLQYHPSETPAPLSSAALQAEKPVPLREPTLSVSQLQSTPAPATMSVPGAGSIQTTPDTNGGTAPLEIDPNFNGGTPVQNGYSMDDLNKLTSADAAKYKRQFGRGGYNPNSINDRMALQMMRNGVDPNSADFQKQVRQRVKDLGFNRTRNAASANRQLANLGFQAAR